MYPGIGEYLPEGCVPGEGAAERDGRIVTGKGPGAVFAFAAALAGALGAETDERYPTMYEKL